MTIEPNNKPILDELKKLPAAKVSTPVKPPTKVEPVEEKRRLPIHVIDEAYTKGKEPLKQKATAAAVKEVTKQTEKEAIKPAEKVVPKPAEKVTPKQTEKSATTEAKVSEKPKIQPVEKETVPVVKTPLKMNVPRTNFEFERDWKTFKGRGDDQLYQYFQVREGLQRFGFDIEKLLGHSTHFLCKYFQVIFRI